MNDRNILTTQLLSHDLALKQVSVNCMAIPTIDHVILHTSTKQIIKNKKYAIPSGLALSLITGQKPKSIYAKNSVAVFHLRKGQFLGWKITLRKSYMHEFLQKLVIIALPQQRGFSGFYFKSMDHQGNFHLGFNNLLVFPELELHFSILEILRGIDINIRTNTKNKLESLMLLSAYQIPINEYRL